jgi:hypothetical protein
MTVPRRPFAALPRNRASTVFSLPALGTGTRCFAFHQGAPLLVIDLSATMDRASAAGRIVGFYNHRGTCEQWIKEGKGAI